MTPEITPIKPCFNIKLMKVNEKLVHLNGKKLNSIV